MGALLEYIALLNRGERTSRIYRTFPTKGHFFKIGKFNQPTRYIEMKTVNRQNKATEEYVPNERTR